MKADDKLARKTKLAKELLLRAAGIKRLHCLYCVDVWPWDGVAVTCPSCGRSTSQLGCRDWLIIGMGIP